MIRRHDFNSKWYGAPVGVIDDMTFFDQTAEAQRSALGAFAWTEMRCGSEDAPAPAVLRAAGFAWVDAQVNFRIRLGTDHLSADAASFEVRDGTDLAFDLDFAQCRSFEHERYAILGLTQAHIDERFHTWASDLVAADPAHCLEILHDGKTQGWFLSSGHDRGSSVQLTLAMSHAKSSASGLLLYERALHEYARRDKRVGSASFSVRNTAVHNLYARLGARFLSPTLCWLQVATASTDPRALSPQR